MFLAGVCPLFLRPHHTLLFTSVYHQYLYWPPDPRRLLNLLPGLRDLFFLVSLTLGANNKIILAGMGNTGRCPAEHPFSHLYSFSHTLPCYSFLQEWSPPLLHPSVRNTFSFPQEGFLRIQSNLLFLVYKSLHDLAFSLHQINLSFCSTIHQICILYLECSSL